MSLKNGIVQHMTIAYMKNHSYSQNFWQGKTIFEDRFTPFKRFAFVFISLHNSGKFLANDLVTEENDLCQYCPLSSFSKLSPNTNFIYGPSVLSSYSCRATNNETTCIQLRVTSGRLNGRSFLLVNSSLDNHIAVCGQHCFIHRVKDSRVLTAHMLKHFYEFGP